MRYAFFLIRCRYADTPLRHAYAYAADAASKELRFFMRAVFKTSMLMMPPRELVAAAAAAMPR